MGPELGPLLASWALPFNLQTQLIYFSLWKICLEKLCFYVMLQLGAPLWQLNVAA